VKILLVQTSWLGDTILSTPLISGIRDIHPGAEIWVLTTQAASALLQFDPRVAGVLTYDKRGTDRGLAGMWRMRNRLMSMRFDRVYSLHKSYRTALLLWASRIPMRIGFSEAKLSFLYNVKRRRPPDAHIVLRNLSLITGEMDTGVTDIRCRLYPPQMSQVGERLRGVLAGLNGYVVLAPGSAWKTKRWTGEGYREVASRLLDQGRQVVLIGAPREKRLVDQVARGLDVVNLAGMTDISETMLVISRSRLVVCNDSMALHMAAALEVPSVAVFCSTTPSLGFGPWKNAGIVIQDEDLDCRPCGPHGFQICPTGTEACMRGVSSATVIEAVERLLETADASDPPVRESGSA